MIECGQCSWRNGLPLVPNSRKVNVTYLKTYSDGQAYGFYDIACDPGYSLDSTIGGRITCLKSGNWSNPLPVCRSMGACPISSLFEFIRTAVGIWINQSTNFIYTNGVDDNHALGGSNITVQCFNGYINVGGSLTIICTQTNTWTLYPRCIPISTSTSKITTVGNSLRCRITDDTWKFTNGYISNTKNILVYNDNTAAGFIMISCEPGYLIDNISQGVFKCNNGTWSPRPYCSITARCSLSVLENFFNNDSQSTGIRIVVQRILANPNENGLALVGSWISFACTTDYTLLNGNLNVSCHANGQWSSFPKCTVESIQGISGPCSWKDDLLTVPNSHKSNTTNLKVFTNGNAYGYYDIECNQGYKLDPTVGARITCLQSGNWSKPLPVCRSMGACLMSDLFEFIQTAEGMRINQSLTFVFTNSITDDRALGGSNITVQCLNGYINVGGPLLIICTEASVWTPYPRCIPISTSTLALTSKSTTISHHILMRCRVTNDTWKFTNGYISNTKNILVYDDNTAAGFIMISCEPGYLIDNISQGVFKCFIMISCEPGYLIDNISQGVFKCNNGTWSPRPYCSISARCSLSLMKIFLNDVSRVAGLQIVSQGVSANPNEDDLVLIGSYVLFACKNRYINTDGNLNVTCKADGKWTNFPICIMNSTTKV
ncbi:unnamed protein product [Rotaria magnacalcarata]|uniref:Sushi domain-containing protein n=1 Tax=Rotaria magnacalcarata TaxID=392030 RepID=A0A8S2KY56_9BILA|nr:unnamed protein product [Rotaria magnacalcarata]CAF3871053.1 unnamed protein product [Rotaria magnacalcarata]CAF3876276.1 unnamed protein product [Rotaria magnacalcarata]